MGIFQAVKDNDIEGVKMWLQKGVDPNVRCQDHINRTPLMIAALYNFVSIAEVLIEAKASLYLQDNTGLTALDIAMGNKHYAVVELLERKMQERKMKHRV